MFEFYNGKRVLITGHTGFKGTWLTRMLVGFGAEVCGYSLCSEKTLDFFEMADVKDKIVHVKGDIRDFTLLKKVFDEFRPEIVFHLAAQPIVRDSYINPVYTYETNVMGTVYVCECVRLSNSVKSFLNVTTDKVYKNLEREEGYREDEPLDGFDPYSNSKSCSELVTHAYINSFFNTTDIAVSTARAGNAIGGGDFANDRIIPDCIRAVKEGRRIGVRNPFSIRPYQHVLEPLTAYLTIAQKQYENKKIAGFYNVGPDESDYITTGNLVKLFCECWGEGASWENQAEPNAPHEATLLRLDCDKIKTVLGWKPHWHINKCMEMICNFSQVLLSEGDIPEEMDKEIKEYLGVVG